MSLTPEQLAKFDQIMLDIANLRDELNVVEPPPPPPPDPGVWPSDGTWDEKLQWIEGRAGLKVPTSELTVVGGNSVPAGCRWSGTNLLVDTATVLENLLVPGTIVTTDRGNNDVVLKNVAAQDVFTWFTNHRRISLIEDCDFFIPESRVAGGWGQGCINTPKPGCIIRRTKIRGGADSAQISGGVTIEECFFSDMVIVNQTHNDFIQNYGGLATLRRSAFRQIVSASQGGHVNGIFNSSANASFDIEDCYVDVQGPGWALHAGSSVIDIRNSFLRGATVGNVRIGENVVRP